MIHLNVASAEKCPGTEPFGAVSGTLLFVLHWWALLNTKAECLASGLYIGAWEPAVTSFTHLFIL